MIFENETDVKLDGNELIYSFGGELKIQDYEHNFYGIDFEKISIHDLTPKQAVTLAVSLVNHLMLNGHDFEISKDAEYGKIFEYKKTHS